MEWTGILYKCKLGIILLFNLPKNILFSENLLQSLLILVSNEPLDYELMCVLHVKQ